MCQLLGMNCNTPTDIVFSFEGFTQRGGLTDHHTDGWGIAFFEGKAARLFIDHQPSIHSPIAELVRTYPIKSLNVIAHIRKATQGEVNLQNCHPFMREMWGQHWVFAHNGNLIGFKPELDGHYNPVGSTDSEAAFCMLLQTLRASFQTPARCCHRHRMKLITFCATSCRRLRNLACLIFACPMAKRCGRTARLSCIILCVSIRFLLHICSMRMSQLTLPNTQPLMIALPSLRRNP